MIWFCLARSAQGRISTLGFFLAYPQPSNCATVLEYYQDVYQIFLEFIQLARQAGSPICIRRSYHRAGYHWAGSSQALVKRIGCGLVIFSADRPEFDVVGTGARSLYLDSSFSEP